MKHLNYIGVGLRHCHFDDFIDSKPKIGWLEVHSENFFAKGGIAKAKLEKISSSYPLSLHGVGLSLGSSNGVDIKHLKRLREIAEEYSPFLLSEHLSWSRTKDDKGTKFYPDLIPIPYNTEILQIICDNINKTQDYLGREILIENPSSYIVYNISTMEEVEFLNEVVNNTGCGLLLDINNIFVSNFNVGLDSKQYIDNINHDAVKEIHLAGPRESIINGKKVLIDTHNSMVRDEVWELYTKFINKAGKKHTLLEWDIDIPELSILLKEGYKIHNYLENE